MMIARKIATVPVAAMVRLVVRKKIAVNMTLVVNEIVYNADGLDRAYPAEARRHEHQDTIASATYYARELALHDQAGIPVWSVLRMATTGNADILGIGKRTGGIARGYEADVAFLDGDPVADIADIGKVYGVLNNTNLLVSSELLEITDVPGAQVP